MLFSNNNNNNNNKRAGQSLKTIAKSAFAITDRTQRNYLAKMQTVRKTQHPFHPFLNEQATFTQHPPVSQTLKQQWDAFMKHLFRKLDFDQAGFVSSSKIAYDKSMGQAVFYFLGGVFQKVKQMGAVTQKMFFSLTDELYLHSKAADIEQLLVGRTPSFYAPISKKKGKSTKHSGSCSLTARSLRMDSSRQGITLTESTINNNSTLPKKYSLKQHLKQLQKDEITRQRRGGRDSNFDSVRVRQLSERLDRQIAHSQTRISLNKYLR